MANALELISRAGVAVWLDDLSRQRLKEKSLEKLISQDYVVGVTTNPSIFAAAIGNSELYHEDILNNQNLSVEDIITKLTTDDVRNACDLFEKTYLATGKSDGRVSIEVDPRFARDTDKTISQGKQLWQIIDRPNLLIKVPATVEGLPAISELIAQGISVNVTLIFSVARYKQVLAAYAEGISRRINSNKSVSDIHSVASFFISRIDTAIDAKLPAESELRGCAAIANAVMAYQAFLSFQNSNEWQAMANVGANVQRPLWASTGVKDPTYDSTRYVMQLVAKHTVNTMPESTLNVVKKSGVFNGDTITPNFSMSKSKIAKLALSGIDINKITYDLELDGVAKFESSWLELMKSVHRIVLGNA